VCKLVAVSFSMGGGLIAGKDGPLIHGGGIVGGGLGGMGSRCTVLFLTELNRGTTHVHIKAVPSRRLHMANATLQRYLSRQTFV
jgi:hypothetical protein